MPVQKSAAACACARHPPSALFAAHRARRGSPCRKKMRPWRKKSLPRAGDACIPLSALNEAPHGKVAQLVRACGSYPQCREFKSPPCYQKATTPDVRKASGVFALWAFCVLGIRVPGLQPAPAQPCPPSALAGTPLFYLMLDARAVPDRQPERTVSQAAGFRLPRPDAGVWHFSEACQCRAGAAFCGKRSRQVRFAFFRPCGRRGAAPSRPCIRRLPAPATIPLSWPMSREPGAAGALKE